MSASGQIFVNIDVPDLLAAVRFYEGGLGFKKRRTLFQGTVAELSAGSTMVQETYASNPDIRDACARSIIVHAAIVERDIELARKQYGIEADWTAASLALYTQAVLQGAFILAKATGGPEIAAVSIDHLIRYLRLLFGLSDNTASTINKQRK